MAIGEEQRITLARWLEDGKSWIGVFENKDLGHHDLGRRIAVPYFDDIFDKAEIGKTRAPDVRPIGLGWRYLLIAKVRTVDEAVKLLEETEPHG